ncbi:MAG: sigma-70 family RNA polymerase sigma factor [Bacteroidales bacterium]|nr:sigma-70 family RNA polymerase sigma factor [Bacteroidales bacterium]
MNANSQNFNQFYAENFNKTVNYISFKVKSLQTAEDLTQNVFTNLYKHFNEYNESKGKLTTWLRKFVNNEIIDHARTNQYGKNCINVGEFVDHETGTEFFQFVGDNETNAEVENNELSAKIEKAFKGLKPAYRTIAELYFIKQMKYNEMVEICGLPMGTIKGMISRCRTMLQAELQTA